jgi:NADPH:quinone reductase-like Zn-dependent oxidoreductase
MEVGEVIEINQMTPPNLSAGKVLVNVKVAGINPIDWKIRRLYATNDTSSIPINLRNGFDPQFWTMEMKTSVQN